MKDLTTFINEGLKLSDEKIAVIEKFLNDKDNYNFDNEITCGLFNKNVQISKDILTDIAGYIVEAYVWNWMKKLITTKEFFDMWKEANPEKNADDFKVNSLERRSGKDIYWDFTINGIDEKFEVKARSTDENGKAAGGYRFSASQKADKNLIYILVKYHIQNNVIIIGDITVTRKG